MKRIHLELARNPDDPEGRSDCGYELIAPIDDHGHSIAADWKRDRLACRVVRFWTDADREVGHLVRKPGGAWAFHYDIDGDAGDDEAGYRFDQRAFLPGEYISIKEHDGLLRTFRVVSVRNVN